MDVVETISALYDGLLGREPDPVGLASHLETWGQGDGASLVIARILDSDEYVQKHAPYLSTRVPRRLGIVHIPKCAGSSLRTKVGKIPSTYVGPLYFDTLRFGAEPRQDPGVDALERECSIGDIGRLFERNAVVMGHYRASSLIEAGADALVVTVREPRSRLLSLYRFWQSLTAEDVAALGAWGEVLSDSVSHGFRSFLTDDRILRDRDNALLVS